LPLNYKNIGKTETEVLSIDAVGGIGGRGLADGGD